MSPVIAFDVAVVAQKVKVGVTLYTDGGGGVTVVVTLRRWWWLQLWCYSGVTLDTGGGQWERRS